ncbi:hypothetical protein Lalb_Chr03g0042581 [Lupinus albus]|uniref:Uncharacterized protein n=1 Tax=Lupinus albus TaxID=3870 RepID=A0A6A4QXI6_LUPAL|nr:hypothetical protein Lalb_Chr03g0042581 [Lupinus albus]
MCIMSRTWDTDYLIIIANAERLNNNSIVSTASSFLEELLLDEDGLICILRSKVICVSYLDLEIQITSSS